MYSAINEQLKALIEGVPHRIANLANAAALLYQELPDVSWAGFYLAQEGTPSLAEGGIKDLPEEDLGRMLVLGPFQGKTACIEIPWGRGVCGTAAKTGQTQLVPDVFAFPGHIACDAASRSEIVVPLFGPDGEVAGVLDLDSAKPTRFDEKDAEGLDAFARIIEKEVFGRA
ncbi:MAG: GAF domain-containing protein [Lachnospiraceae bacterium]|nr:GAF domain-containing protein [Lachnospiraceae bacterium]